MLDIAGDGRLFIDAGVQVVVQERLSPTWDGRFPRCRLPSSFPESGRKRVCSLHVHTCMSTVVWMHQPIGMAPEDDQAATGPRCCSKYVPRYWARSETVRGSSRQPSNSSVDNCRRTRFKNCCGCLIEGGKEGIACLQGIPNCPTFSQSIHRGEHGTSASCGRQAGKGHSRRSLRCRVRVVLPARLDGRLSFQPQGRSCPMTRAAVLYCLQTLGLRHSRLESRQTTATDATAASSEDALSQCVASCDTHIPGFTVLTLARNRRLPRVPTSFTPSTRVCYSRQGSNTQVKRPLRVASSSPAGGRFVETDKVPGARPSARGTPVLQRLALAASHRPWPGRYLPARGRRQTRAAELRPSRPLQSSEPQMEAAATRQLSVRRSPHLRCSADGRHHLSGCRRRVGIKEAGSATS